MRNIHRSSQAGKDYCAEKNFENHKTNSMTNKVKKLCKSQFYALYSHKYDNNKKQLNKPKLKTYIA